MSLSETTMSRRGSPDLVGRIIAGKLSESLRQQVIVDNRGGAGTMIGTEIVARASLDGYTLLMAGAALAINPAVYRKVPYDAVADFAPVTQVVSLPFVLVVHPAVAAKCVKELVALARAKPASLSFASAGLGSSPHLAMELFLRRAGDCGGRFLVRGRFCWCRHAHESRNHAAPNAMRFMTALLRATRTDRIVSTSQFSAE